MRRTFLALVFVLLGAPASLLAQDAAIPAATKTKIDKAVPDLLTKSGAPSASIAVVVDGKLAYARAYGTARLDSKREATAEMRYSIGSISKQFTAAAILLLEQEGKISLDDKLAHWFPELTRAGDISVRELLSMTSGYQDYWPQDYVMPMMRN
ncbi:MAG TPA: serine hydrolase domain-containing protein, partial [Chthoniobacterales bacterium]